MERSQLEEGVRTHFGALDDWSRAKLAEMQPGEGMPAGIRGGGALLEEKAERNVKLIKTVCLNHGQGLAQILTVGLSSAILEIEGYVGGVSEVEFVGNSMMRSATVRQFEIIGESAKAVSEELKEMNPQSE